MTSIFHSQIGRHDQAVWEQQAEKKFKVSYNQEVQLLYITIDLDLIIIYFWSNFQEFPATLNSKRTKLKKELIDVDLIRGSNYEKPKPIYNWTDITFFGLLRLLFLPFYFKWYV